MDPARSEVHMTSGVSHSQGGTHPCVTTTKLFLPGCLAGNGPAVINKRFKLVSIPSSFNEAVALVLVPYAFHTPTEYPPPSSTVSAFTVTVKVAFVAVGMVWPLNSH